MTLLALRLSVISSYLNMEIDMSKEMQEINQIATMLDLAMKQQLDLDDQQLVTDCIEDLKQVMENYGEPINILAWGLMSAKVANDIG